MKKKKLQKTRLIIDIKNDYIFFCVGTFDGVNVKVDKLFKKEVDYEILVDSKVVNADLVANTIKAALAENNIKIKEAYTYIVGADVIRKTLVVPYVENQDDFDELIQSEISQVFPLNLNDFIIKYKFVSEEKNENFHKIKLNCAIMNREIVESYRNILKLAGLKPVVLDLNSSALENLVKFIIMSNSDDIGLYRREIENSLIAFAEINTANCSIHVFKGGVFDFTRTIKTPPIKKDVVDHLVNSTSTDEISNFEVFEVLNDILAEINMMFKYYTSRERTKKVDEIFLYGAAARIAGLDTYAQDIIGMTVNRITFIDKIIDENTFNENIALYLCAIGGLIRW